MPGSILGLRCHSSGDGVLGRTFPKTPSWRNIVMARKTKRMGQLDSLEARIDQALKHYEEHSAAFKTLSRELALCSEARTDTLREVKNWIAEIRAEK
jgi:hypothetical protein